MAEYQEEHPVVEEVLEYVLMDLASKCACSWSA